MSGQNTFPILPLMFSWSPAAADSSAVVLLTKANVKVFGNLSRINFFIFCEVAFSS